jgi:hypothetical protein
VRALLAVDGVRAEMSVGATGVREHNGKIGLQLTIPKTELVTAPPEFMAGLFRQTFPAISIKQSDLDGVKMSPEAMVAMSLMGLTVLCGTLRPLSFRAVDGAFIYAGNLEEGEWLEN